jgi:hypothetical protein
MSAESTLVIEGHTDVEGRRRQPGALRSSRATNTRQGIVDILAAVCNARWKRRDSARRGRESERDQAQSGPASCRLEAQRPSLSFSFETNRESSQWRWTYEWRATDRLSRRGSTGLPRVGSEEEASRSSIGWFGSEEARGLRNARRRSDGGRSVCGRPRQNASTEADFDENFAATDSEESEVRRDWEYDISENEALDAGTVPAPMPVPKRDPVPFAPVPTGCVAGRFRTHPARTER